MTAQLDPSAVEQIFARAGVSPGLISAAPIVLLAADRPSIVWANAPAVSLLGAQRANEASRRLFRPGPSSLALVDRIRRMASGPEPRLERLMISQGFQITPHTVACRTVEGMQSEPLILVQFLQAQPVHPIASPRFESALIEESTDQAGPATSTPAVVPSEPASPSRETVAEVAQRLATQFAGRTLVRVLWETDAGGLVTQVGRDFEAVAGRSSLTVGDDIVARLGRLDEAVAQAVRDALGQRQTATGLRLLWPIHASEAAVMVEIGCAKRTGAASGLRGFCLIHTNQLSLRDTGSAPERADADAAPNPGLQDHLVVASQTEPGQSPGDADASIATPEVRALFPAVTAPPSNPTPDNVVHFPIVKGLSFAAPTIAEPRLPDQTRSMPSDIEEEETAPLQPPLWSESPRHEEVDAPGSLGHLSTDEQDAFEHIRKVLGTRPFADGTTDLEMSSRLDDEIAPAATAISLVDPAPPQAPWDLRLLDSLPLGIMLHRNKTLLHVNAPLLQQLGLATAQQASTNAELVRLLDRSANQVALESGDPLVVIASDGRRLHGEIQTIPFDGAPATLAIFDLKEKTPPADPSIRAPVTDDGRSKEEDAVLSLVADGIGFIDASGLIGFATPGAEQLFGFRAGDLVGQPAASLLMSDQEPIWRSLLALAADTDRSQSASGDLLGRTRNGNLIPLNVRIGRITADKFCVVWSDDSSRKRAENGLDAARREAERANTLKSEFLAKVSHEIRTPLNAILGFAEVIMDERLGPVGNSRYVEYLKDIHASGTHVMSLVNDLLDLSRIEAGRLDLKLEAVDVNTVVSACVNTLQTQSHRERVIVRLSLAPHLPPALADERSLRQIVLNLLSNAIKFNEPGGQVIVSTALTDAETVAIRIRDTGLGMSDQDIETAMEPFRQLPTGKSSNGSGLGLPLTKALVEASCASMTIKSRPGEGTLVEVVFPIVEQQGLSVPAE